MFFLKTLSLGEQFKMSNPEWGSLIFNRTINPCILSSHCTCAHIRTTQYIHHAHTDACTHTHVHTHAHILHYTQHAHSTYTQHTHACVHTRTTSMHAHTHSAVASSRRSPGSLLSRVCLPRAVQPVQLSSRTRTLTWASVAFVKVLALPSCPSRPSS